MILDLWLLFGDKSKIMTSAGPGVWTLARLRRPSGGGSDGARPKIGRIRL